MSNLKSPTNMVQQLEGPVGRNWLTNITTQNDSEIIKALIKVKTLTVTMPDIFRAWAPVLHQNLCGKLESGYMY